MTEKALDMWRAKAKFDSSFIIRKAEVGSTRRLASADESLTGFAPIVQHWLRRDWPGPDDGASPLGRKRQGGWECPKCIRLSVIARTAGAVG